MIPITLSLFALAALGAAQNSTVSLFLPAFDTQSLVGSVVAADSKATTYVITCASGMGDDSAAATTYGGDAAASTTGMKSKKRQAAAMTTAMPTASPSDNPFDDTDHGCGLISPLTVTEGPSTLAYTLSLGPVAVEALSCVLSGTTKAVCGVSASAASGYSLPSDVTVSPTATLTGSDLPDRIPVVITAGADKLSSGGSGSGGAGTTTGTATNAGSTMTTGTGKAGGNSGTKGTGTGTGTGSAAPASSTGGAAMGFEPAMGMGIVGAVAVGLGAILL